MVKSTMWAAVALLTVGLSGVNAAVTFNPGGAAPMLGSPGIGTTGNAFTFDSLATAEFATEASSTGRFNETGFLSITGARSGSTPFTPIGLGGTTAGGGQTSGLYTLYLAFSASGNSTAPDFNTPNASPYSLPFTTFSYTLYGVNGQSTFSFAGTTPTVTNSSTPVLLATGSLIGGASNNPSILTVSSGGTPSPGSAYQISPSSPGLNLTFVPNTAESGFFVSPTALTTLNLTDAFSVEPGVVNLVDSTTIEIDNGRGTLGGFSSVPEPATATFMCGLLVALVGPGRRRIFCRGGTTTRNQS